MTPSKKARVAVDAVDQWQQHASVENPRLCHRAWAPRKSLCSKCILMSQIVPASELLLKQPQIKLGT